MTVELLRSGTPLGGLGPALPHCLDAAIAAPSIYNTQPWRFRVAARHVDVLADRERRLAVIDLSGRELAISVGAAIFNLRVAMLAHHRRPVVHLLPDAAEPDLHARVAVAGAMPPSTTVLSLARAIPLRHTNRRPFFPTAVPPEVLADLQDAAAAEGARLVTATPAARDTVLGTVRVAEALRRRQPAYLREIGEWTTDDRLRLDGVPPATFGPWNAVESLPLRDFGLVHPGRLSGNRDAVAAINSLVPVASGAIRSPPRPVMPAAFPRLDAETPHNHASIGRNGGRVTGATTVRTLFAANSRFW